MTDCILCSRRNLPDKRHPEIAIYNASEIIHQFTKFSRPQSLIFKLHQCSIVLISIFLSVRLSVWLIVCLFVYLYAFCQNTFFPHPVLLLYHYSSTISWLFRALIVARLQQCCGSLSILRVLHVPYCYYCLFTISVVSAP